MAVAQYSLLQSLFPPALAACTRPLNKLISATDTGSDCYCRLEGRPFTASYPRKSPFPPTAPLRPCITRHPQRWAFCTQGSGRLRYKQTIVLNIQLNKIMLEFHSPKKVEPNMFVIRSVFTGKCRTRHIYPIFAGTILQNAPTPHTRPVAQVD